MAKPSPTASDTPPPPTPTPPALKNRSIIDDATNMGINELMPLAVKVVLDLVPKNKYKTIFQEKAKYWSIALPILSYITLRVFNAPKIVDDLSTDFFAQLRREIDMRAAGKEDGESKPVGSDVQTKNLLRLLLVFPENLKIYGKVIAGKKDEEVQKIRSFLNTLTPEELIAFFAMDDAHRETLLATFVAKNKKTKSLGKLLAGLRKKVKKSWITQKVREAWTNTSLNDITESIDKGAGKTADAIDNNINNPLQNWADKRNKRNWFLRLLWPW